MKTNEIMKDIESKKTTKEIISIFKEYEFLTPYDNGHYIAADEIIKLFLSKLKDQTVKHAENL